MNTSLNEYLDIVNNTFWKNDTKMQDYIKKTTSNVYKTFDGLYINFSKPTIKKKFCFCTGLAGEHEKAAHEELNEAKTNANYFISKNLENIQKEIECLKNDAFFLKPNFHGDTAKNIVCYVKKDFCRQDLKIIRKITAQEKDDLISILEIEKDKLLKRLNTYLKKYSLTKLNCWTFCEN